MGYKRVKTGHAIQYKCDCGNVYDEKEQAETCQHDFYDGETGERL